MSCFSFWLCINCAVSLSWRVSNVKLPYELEGAVAAVHNDYISILGGYYLDIIDNKKWQLANDKTYKYPINKIISSNNIIEWSSITPSLAIGGQQSQFVHFNNKIYAYTNQLNIYDLTNDLFVSTSSYSERSTFGFSGGGDCVIGINEQYMFITGGYSGPNALKTTQIYDVNKDEWLVDSYPMHISRGYHTCVYSHIDSNIYIISGLTGVLNDDIYTKSMETFHINTLYEWNEWNGWKISDLSLDIGLRCMMAVEYHNYIYLFGGLYASWSDLAHKYDNKVINVIIRFNVTTQTMVYDSMLPRYTFWAPIIVYNDHIMVFGGWGFPNDGKFEQSIQIADFSETVLNISNISNFTRYADLQNIKTPTTSASSSDNYPMTTRSNMDSTYVTKNTLYYTTLQMDAGGNNKNVNKMDVSTKWILGAAAIIICGLIVLYIYCKKYINVPNDIHEELQTTQLNTNRNDYNIEMEGLNANEEQCVICMDSLSAIGKIGKLECGHKFHRKCLIEWVESNQTCPLCRMPCSNMSFI
eukprot:385857_1